MMNFCTPEYFRVMQMRLLRGRLLEERDGPAAQEVIVINDTLARRSLSQTKILSART